LWGKMPMQDDPIHLRCDSALATNRYSYSSFFLYEIERREMDGLTGVFRLSLDPVSLLFGSPQLLAFSSSPSFKRFLTRELLHKRRTLHKDIDSYS
jgi:hypothetical protein